MSVANREKQVAEAEELLGDGGPRLGFAKGLFFGQYLGDRLLPYPDIASDLQARSLVSDLRKFCKEQIDPVKIDHDAEIPEHGRPRPWPAGRAGRVLAQELRRRWSSARRLIAI